MRKVLLVIVVLLVAAGAFAGGAWFNESRQGSKPSAPSQPAHETYIHATGTPTHYLTVTTRGHGELTSFAAYYEDGYVHGDRIPAANGRVIEFEHYTCEDPETRVEGVKTRYPCGDRLLSASTGDYGLLNQVHTVDNHNRRIDAVPKGQGPVLQWRTYEHLAHTKFEYEFADGYELYVVLDTPVYVWDTTLTVGSRESAVFH
jgi:hypothetical protein